MHKGCQKQHVRLAQSFQPLLNLNWTFALSPPTYKSYTAQKRPKSQNQSLSHQLLQCFPLCV